MVVRNWLLSLSSFRLVTIIPTGTKSIISSLPVRPFCRLANDHSIHAPANRKCSCSADVAPKALPYPMLYYHIPAKKLLSRSRASVPICLPQRQTEPRYCLPCVHTLMWTISSCQNTTNNSTEMVCSHHFYRWNTYCHKTPKTRTSKIDNTHFICGKSI